MPLSAGSDRASPWPIFGNLLAQGVAMANFRIWAVTPCMDPRLRAQFFWLAYVPTPLPSCCHPVPWPFLFLACLAVVSRIQNYILYYHAFGNWR